MKSGEKTIITVGTSIKAPVDKVWTGWTEPEHIISWNQASDNWHSPSAENDLRAGGRFVYRMEARDGSTGFDFSGKYSKVDHFRLINYRLDDGREVQVEFIAEGNQTLIQESFEAENTNPPELQKEGWQAILNNFKRYVESHLV